jgi:hypothetical protein
MALLLLLGHKFLRIKLALAKVLQCLIKQGANLC